jgi:hypothetical protein
MEWAIIKGVSDFADGKKVTENWQAFSSAMAASVVYNMFKHAVAIKHWPRYLYKEPETTAGSYCNTEGLPGGGGLCSFERFSFLPLQLPPRFHHVVVFT